jgi:hypothetical protein
MKYDLSPCAQCHSMKLPDELYTLGVNDPDSPSALVIVEVCLECRRELDDQALAVSRIEKLKKSS